MGGCTPSKNETSKIIDKLLKEDRRKNKVMKILLLGTGDSGKSTFCKQMKVIHKNGFSHSECQYYQTVLRDNCIEVMRDVVSYCKKNPDLYPKEVEHLISEYSLLEGNDTSYYLGNVEKMWENEKMKKFIKKKSHDMNILTSFKYLFDNIKRFKEDFTPSVDDILRAKLKTTGVIETEFSFHGNDFALIDVGGQRAERRKWLQCFDVVQCVIYIGGLDEYYLRLREDNKTNRFSESLVVFEKVTASPYMIDKNIIVFLNKSDIFAHSIKKHPLTEYFRDISPDQSKDYDACIEFFKEKYRKAYRGKSSIYFHVTNALDTTNCERVFLDCRDMVLKERTKLIPI
jgi:GTPase SAR1 family protein